MRDRPRASMKMGQQPPEAPTTPPPPAPPQPTAPTPPVAQAPPAVPKPRPYTPRQPAENPRQSEYDRLMEIVAQLRRQFPEKSEPEILELARKILVKEKEDTDLWDSVKREYGVAGQSEVRAPVSPQPKRPWTPGPNDRGSEAGVPFPKTGAKPDASGAKPYVYGGIPGLWVPNPEYGKQNGFVLEGGRWVDGTAQNQALQAQQSDQQFLAEKRRMELERLQMEMQLERLRKEREMAELRKDPALVGLIAGTANQNPVRPPPPGMLY